MQHVSHRLTFAKQHCNALVVRRCEESAGVAAAMQTDDRLPFHDTLIASASDKRLAIC
jgi:hypothetical protein